MRILKSAFILSLLFLVVSSQWAFSQENQAGAAPKMSAEAAAYLEDALNLMEKHSMNRSKINWPEFRKNAIEKAGAAQTMKDTYDAIRFALRELKDRHSFLILPVTPAGAGGGSAPRKTLPQGEMLEGKFAYVMIPGMGDPSEGPPLLEIVRKLEAQNPCGWIVDLRQNTGGNMWPMLMGIGPVLGDGLLGSFVSPEGHKTNWYYTEGQVKIENNVITKADGPVFRIKNPSAPVAVLTSGRTASSGEAVATAFRGRPNTRSFGVGTYGVSTANTPFPLKDGARLNMTTATYADRTGKLYGSTMEPDEVINSVTDYQVIKAALGWLTKQSPCAGAK